MRGVSLFLLFAVASVCASVIPSAPKTNAGTTDEERRSTWNPREPTIGWDDDRHTGALRLSDTDRETPARNREEWKQFRATFRANRLYQNSSDEEFHARIFEESELMVAESLVAYENGWSSYYLGINQFADMTREEAAKYRMQPETLKRTNELLSNASWSSDMADVPTLSGKDSSFIASSFDWRKRINMTAVKNQGACGSCYAFGTMAAVEAQIALKYGRTVSLSEQQVVDCSIYFEGDMNGGCGGGHEVVTMDYLKSRTILTEAQYPYQSGGTNRHYSCRTNGQQGEYKLTYYKRVRALDEKAVAEAVVQYGPLVVSISGENRDFQLFRGGIYANPTCPKVVDHVVSTFGYGTQGGRDYWLIRNSWDKTWGEDGYGKVLRGVNQCGIASDNSWGVEV